MFYRFNLITANMKQVRSFTVIPALLAVFLLFSQASEAKVILPRVLGSNMVIQRNADVKIWGTADSGERITVDFNGQKAKAKAGKDGKWQVILGPMEAGGPYTMTISGENTIRLENILVGDVWVCSGQSNMEWTVKNSNNAGEEIAAAAYPGIRLFTVPRNLQYGPVDDLPSGSWAECTPETVGDFSAVGYFFGREIHLQEGVPVGLISSSWGGTNVETWTSREMAMQTPGMKEAAEGLSNKSMEEMRRKMQEDREALLLSLGGLEEGIIDGKPVWAADDADLSAWKEMEIPGAWESRGLPGLDGVVWFRTTFSLTKEQAAAGITLHLGTIDDTDRTWVNGSEVGGIYNRYNVKRVYEVPAGVLRQGINTLTVRVEDYQGGGGIDGMPDDLAVITATRPVPLAGTWKYRVSAAGLKINTEPWISPNSSPTLLFNGMIHPLLNYAVLGVIWYQGESNASQAVAYRTRFPNLINDWRNHWDNPEMGFYFVQLANYMDPAEQPNESAWAELREAQTMALSLPKTGMAVAIDIGEADDIHPRNKQDVGRRLALAALHDTYGRDVVYAGPVLKEMRTEGNRLILEFDPMGSDLVVKDKYGYVKGFAVAGEDRVFHWARGWQDGNRITLESSAVKAPVAVRYGWADNPDDLNIYNAEGLPAGPFRTDDWR